MLTITLNMYQTAGVAMLLFVLGRFLTTRIDFLKRCCIPAPVVGGLIFALAHLALYMGGVVQFTFDDNVKNFFMTLFFTSVGYTACFRLLKKGGKKVFTFLLIAIVMVFLQDVLGAATGLNLLNASLVLAVMSLPTICSVSEDALRAVPRSLREASLALGATRWETIVRVVVPAALSGIGTAIMLGMSRAMGETMVVLMAAGGAAMLPQSLLDPVRPMPASIAAEMAEAPFRSDHYYALFATGIVLFLMTLAFNMIASRIAEKHRQVGSASL